MTSFLSCFSNMRFVLKGFNSGILLFELLNIVAMLRMLLYHSVIVHFLLSTRCDYLLEVLKAKYTIVMNLW